MSYSTQNTCLRLTWLAVVAAFGFWMIGFGRVTVWGLTEPWRVLADSLILFGVFVLPGTVIGLIGMPWRAKLISTLAMAAITIGSAEIFARLQEYQLMHEFGDSPPSDFCVHRWPPFESAEVGLQHGKWWACD